MTTRRDFLQMTAMAAGCVVSFPRNAFGQDPGNLNYGVQLYMVRRQAPKDLAGSSEGDPADRLHADRVVPDGL